MRGMFEMDILSEAISVIKKHSELSPKQEIAAV